MFFYVWPNLISSPRLLNFILLLVPIRCVVGTDPKYDPISAPARNISRKSVNIFLRPSPPLGTIFSRGRARAARKERPTR